MNAVIGLVITIGWMLVWLVAAGIAIAQILRGRALAGALVGFAAILGLVEVALGSTIRALVMSLGDAVGVQVASGISTLLFGCWDAFVVFLLIVGAVLQRPPRPAA